MLSVSNVLRDARVPSGLPTLLVRRNIQIEKKSVHTKCEWIIVIIAVAHSVPTVNKVNNTNVN